MAVNIYVSPEELDPAGLPLTALGSDWEGSPLAPPVRWGMGLDPDFLHFRVAREAEAHSHPAARRGKFQADLWKHDVAEFFLRDPSRSHYLEFNLAPNGAWWSCEFSLPRQRTRATEAPIPGVRTDATIRPDGWEARAAVPRRWLEERLGVGPGSRGNVTFILDSPRQRFASVTPPRTKLPDFHDPRSFAPVVWRPGPPKH